MNTQKRIKTEKTGDKDRKALYKLINNAIYGKTMEDFRNRNNVKLVNNEKCYLKVVQNIWQYFSCDT